MTTRQAAARKHRHGDQKHTQRQLPNRCLHGRRRILFHFIFCSGGKERPPRCMWAADSEGCCGHFWGELRHRVRGTPVMTENCRVGCLPASRSGLEIP